MRSLESALALKHLPAYGLVQFPTGPGLWQAFSAGGWSNVTPQGHSPQDYKDPELQIGESLQGHIGIQASGSSYLPLKQ